jgi:DNA-binding response OmpR family regulator
VPTRLLIAEDEASILESLVFLLGREGYDILSARDGEDALRQIRAAAGAGGLGLVILDVMLPRLNGFDVLKAMRADPALSALPVLMLTAKGQARDRDMAERMGANAFIAKPFSNREVIEQARRLMAP